MEQPIVSAVTSDVTEARITVSGIPDGRASPPRVFRALAAAEVNVDMIVQSSSIGAR